MNLSVNLMLGDAWFSLHGVGIVLDYIAEINDLSLLLV